MTRAALRKQDESSSEQLLELYWNRALVKRELKTLQKERFELLDKLKDQESEILKAKEQLDGLERLLVNPIAAANAMVYFQLRHLWRVGANQVEQFAAELLLQSQKRERARLHEEAVAKLDRRLAALAANLSSLQKKLGRVLDEAQRLDREYRTMNGLIRLFRGARMRGRLEAVRSARVKIEDKIEEGKHLTEKIQGEPLPEPEGISTESRRAINTALIALAQHLTLHFAENNLVTLAKAAIERPVSDMRFGDRRECDRMVERIRDKIADLSREVDLAEKVRKRAAALRKEFEYPNDSDAVPSAFCTPFIAPHVGHGSERRRATDEPLKINVIADDYFDLSNYYC